MAKIGVLYISGSYLNLNLNFFGPPGKIGVSYRHVSKLMEAPKVPRIKTPITWRLSRRWKIECDRVFPPSRLEGLNSIRASTSL